MPHRNAVKTLAVLLLVLSPCAGQTAPAQEKNAPPQPVRLRVLVPQANAQLMLFDVATRQQGLQRSFESSPLPPGKKYFYELTVIWEPNNYTRIKRTRRVDVRPGETFTVDLRLEDKIRPDDIKIRYVPTPSEVVDEMLKLAQVRKGDVVFDLGCGDGRIVVDAVRNYGAARGVGVDIDPQRIKDSHATARKYNVSGKVEFREGDVLKKIDDLAGATVVTLYMGENVNLELRPVLRQTLKPGARVVSHRFTMGDWQPDKSITVKDRQGIEYKLHLWLIGEKSKEK